MLSKYSGKCSRTGMYFGVGTPIERDGESGKWYIVKPKKLIRIMRVMLNGGERVIKYGSEPYYCLCIRNEREYNGENKHSFPQCEMKVKVERAKDNKEYLICDNCLNRLEIL